MQAEAVAYHMQRANKLRKETEIIPLQNRQIAFMIFSHTAEKDAWTQRSEIYIFILEYNT